MPTNELWGPDWDEVRSNWELDPEVAHLNHGSYGAVPKAVLSKQLELGRRTEANPHDFHFRKLYEELNEARAIAAGFVGADLVPSRSSGTPRPQLTRSCDRSISRQVTKSSSRTRSMEGFIKLYSI